jgi:hypothetical protein
VLGSLPNRQTGSFGAIATMIGWCDLTMFCFAAPVQG